MSIPAIIYTDGSCHTQSLVGAWVAIIMIDGGKKQLSGSEKNTTHNRMELTAVIKAMEFLQTHYKTLSDITVYSDSQYVIGLAARKKNLNETNFISAKGRPLQNADLIKILFRLYESFNVQTVKIKAHERLNDLNELNIEADHLSRQLMRESMKK